MKDLLSQMAALADAQRVRILMAVRERELCVCQLIELLGLAPSTVSRHATILHQAGLLQTRKDGRWVYYRIAGPKAPPAVRGLLRWVTRCLGDDPEIVRDAKRLQTVCRMRLDTLCGRYKSRET